jgi:hypothetical protein
MPAAGAHMASSAAMPAAAVPPVLPGQEPLTASMLAQAPPEQQKQVCTLPSRWNTGFGTVLLFLHSAR